MENKDALIQKLNEYILFLDKHLSAASSFAWAHGLRPASEDVAEGDRRRNEIAALRNEIFASPAAPEPERGEGGGDPDWEAKEIRRRIDENKAICQQPIASGIEGGVGYRWVKCSERFPDFPFIRMMVLREIKQPFNKAVTNFSFDFQYNKVHFGKTAFNPEDVEWLEEYELFPQPTTSGEEKDDARPWEKKPWPCICRYTPADSAGCTFPNCTRYNKAQPVASDEEKTLGQLLKEARESKGFTPKSVLDETGVSNEYLRKLEADEFKTQSAAVLWKLAQYYSLDLKPLCIKAGIIIKKPTTGESLEKILNAQYTAAPHPSGNDVEGEAQEDDLTYCPKCGEAMFTHSTICKRDFVEGTRHLRAHLSDVIRARASKTQAILFLEQQLSATNSRIESLTESLAILQQFRDNVAGERDEYQDRVAEWLLACFGEEIANDRMERNFRFLEEALELVQSNGCDAEKAHALVDYVYGRPAGEIKQECGGVMVTLASLCHAVGIKMGECGRIELARVWGKMDQIRAKQAAKKIKSGPLP